MANTHADVLRSTVRTMDTMLCESPADIVSLALMKDPLGYQMPAPLEWVPDPTTLTPFLSYLDHSPPKSAGVYWVIESKIDSYLTRYAHQPHATPKVLLWDIAAATVWKRFQENVFDPKSLDTKDLMLSPDDLSALVREFCSISPGVIPMLCLEVYGMHMDAYRPAYERFSKERYPADRTLQEQCIDLLCTRDSEAKSVGCAGVYVLRQRDEASALQFLVRCRDTFQGIVRERRAW